MHCIQSSIHVLQCCRFISSNRTVYLVDRKIFVTFVVWVRYIAYPLIAPSVSRLSFIAHVLSSSLHQGGAASSPWHAAHNCLSPFTKDNFSLGGIGDVSDLGTLGLVGLSVCSVVFLWRQHPSDPNTRRTDRSDLGRFAVKTHCRYCGC